RGHSPSTYLPVGSADKNQINLRPLIDPSCGALAAVGTNEGMRGPYSRKDTRLSKGPRVKVSEKKPNSDRFTETEVEHNYGRSEGERQRCSTSGWQHFHLSNQTTHPLQFLFSSSLIASLFPRWVSVCCPLHPHYLPTLPTSIPFTTQLPLFLRKHTLYAHTLAHTLWDVNCDGGDFWDETKNHSVSPLLPTTGEIVAQRKLTSN
uniref:Uncharacterized protein n=1 Tax=Echeneis naucrates TaxID=173247 RepID=A0A665WIE5_ECHNA